MPSTRSSNKDANFNAYYTKKPAPKQSYFPHRRKTVRRPDPDGLQDEGKKQGRLKPGMMRTNTVQDSDDEEAFEVEAVEHVKQEIEEETAPPRRRGKKRRSDVMSHESLKIEKDHEPAPSAQKRRRSNAAPTPRRRRAVVAVETSDDDDVATQSNNIRKPTLRRQSTMTQIVDGRLPDPDGIEPEFKPVKRGPRTSWGGKGNKMDKKQQTLTQMVPGLTPLVLDSDEELPEEIGDDDFEPMQRSPTPDDVGQTPGESPPAEDVDDDIVIANATSSLPVLKDDEDETEDEYYPTQFIDAPAKPKRTPRRASTRHLPTPVTAKASASRVKKSPKTRFALLSTPEKRGVFEIPSSQSPPESPLSTQNTPRKLNRSPLTTRSTNALKFVQTLADEYTDTESKRKHVAFQGGPQEQIPPPLKKFTSTIPDSEDDEGDLSEVETQSDNEYLVGEETQALLQGVAEPITGINVGAETQAVLDQIDRACASRMSSEEPDEPTILANEVSQELGLHCLASNSFQEQPADAEDSAYPSVKEQPPSSPPIATPAPFFRPETPEMDAERDTSSAPQSPSPAKRRPTPPAFSPKKRPDLSASAPRPTQNNTSHSPTESQLSHSSEASQQFHTETQSYSQYRTHAYAFPVPAAPSTTQGQRPPPSSMQVAPDTHASYQATPRAPHAARPSFAPPQSTNPNLTSQATTVMEPTQFSFPHKPTTPRKIKTEPGTKIKQEPLRSATVTPQVTPRKTQRGKSVSDVEDSPGALPPPLMIPSSFPSPARVVMEGWSSPVLGAGETQRWGAEASLVEEFSIPAMPPMEGWEDEEVNDEEEPEGDDEEL